MKLIDKSAVVTEIKGYISNYKEIVAKTNRNDSTWVDFVSIIDAKIDVLQHVLFFLDTLKVKEVDIEKIIEQTYYDGSVIDTADIDHVTYENVALHFYELGLKAQKGG